MALMKHHCSFTLHRCTIRCEPERWLVCENNVLSCVAPVDRGRTLPHRCICGETLLVDTPPLRLILQCYRPVAALDVFHRYISDISGKALLPGSSPLCHGDGDSC